MQTSQSTDLYRVMIKGGVLSPSELKQIVEMAEAMGLDFIHFGSRQDILFPLSENQAEVINRFPRLTVEPVVNRNYQNIVCSYVSADIFPTTPWLRGATYLYILEQFRYTPRLEINITDPRQRLVPLFSGELNFIASSFEDYWYLYLRMPNQPQLQRYPVLINSWDIAKVAKAIEDLYWEVDSVQNLFETINRLVDTNSRTLEKELEVPFYPFPYYEGMNRMGVDQYWVGLYWRNNCYDLKFLKAMCELCLECRIGKICITPWKSFIIKGLHQDYKLSWEKLLGNSGINIRHSSLELNWHLPVADQEALSLKQFLVRSFDQNDISTYGLTFGVSSSYGKNFTSIVIQKNPLPKVVRDFQFRPTFNVLYSENFDPNSQRYITYAQDIDKIELPGLLMELSRLYFSQLGQQGSQMVESGSSQQRSTAAEESLDIPIYQCSNCLTVFDPAFGDERGSIPAGTTFEELPEAYCCPLCEAPKAEFVKADQLKLA